MDNEEQRRLADSFALLKVAVMKTPELDKIMVVQCMHATILFCSITDSFHGVL